MPNPATREVTDPFAPTRAPLSRHQGSRRAADPLSCPRCAARAEPARDPQTCGHCGGPFILLPGARLDPSASPPPPDGARKELKTKFARAFFFRRGVVGSEAVHERMLDPILGLVTLDEWLVPYAEIETLALWRRIDAVGLILTLLVPMPLALLLLGFAIEAPMFLVFAAPVALLAGAGLYGALVRRAHFLRVVGAETGVILRFDRPARRRWRFLATLLERAGIRAEVRRLP